jgi:hypothetical protein
MREFKKFDGFIYKYDSRFRLKKDAQSRARILKSVCKTRIINDISKDGVWFVVYVKDRK